MATKRPGTAQETVRAPKPIRYAKGQLLTFRRYAGRRDLLTVLLDDEKEYDTASVDDLIQAFMKGENR